MCEFKGLRSAEAQAENMKLTVATIEGGSSFILGQPAPLKGSEYFENALAATTFGKFNYIMIFISGLILSNVLLETLGISFVLPVSHCDLNLTIPQRGILSAIGFAGIISSSHLWGFLADTTGRRNIIRPTLLLGFFVTVLSSFSTNFWLLAILRYINGFCISGGSATIYAYLGEFHTSKNRSRAIMGSAFIFGIGAMMMPALAWLVINREWRFVFPLLGITYKPWRFFIVVCGIPGFICGLCLFKIPESPKFLLAQGDQEACLRILRNIFHMNTGRPCDEYPIAHVIEDLDTAMRPRAARKQTTNAATALMRSMWDQTQPLFNREYRRTTILICSMQFWNFVTSNGMYMWFPHILNSVAEFMNEHPGNRTYICQVVYDKQLSILKQELAAAAVQASGAMPLAAAMVEQCNEKLELSTYHYSLVLEVLYAVGFAFIGLIINKAGKMGILFTCLFVSGVCGIINIYVNMPMVSIYLILVLLLCGLGVNVLSAATVDLYPTRLRAMAVCISLMMGRLGSVVGANVMGALLSNYCETAFILSGTTLIISGFLVFFIPKPVKYLGNQESPRRASLLSMRGN